MKKIASLSRNNSCTATSTGPFDSTHLVRRLDGYGFGGLLVQVLGGEWGRTAAAHGGNLGTQVKAANQACTITSTAYVDHEMVTMRTAVSHTGAIAPAGVGVGFRVDFEVCCADIGSGTAENTEHALESQLPKADAQTTLIAFLKAPHVGPIAINLLRRGMLTGDGWDRTKERVVRKKQR